MKVVTDFASAKRAGKQQAGQFFTMCLARQISPLKAKKELRAWFDQKKAGERLSMLHMDTANKAADEEWERLVKIWKKQKWLLLVKKVWPFVLAVAASVTLAEIMFKLSR